MAEWEHKERNWSNFHQDDVDGNSVSVREWVSPHSTMETSEYFSFPEWLNWQCENGWEVIKISRNFNIGNGDCPHHETWCVFRRAK